MCQIREGKWNGTGILGTYKTSENSSIPLELVLFSGSSTKFRSVLFSTENFWEFAPECLIEWKYDIKWVRYDIKLNTRKENIPYLRVPCIILYSNLPCFLSNRQVQQFPVLRKDPGTTQKGCYCTITPNLVKEASTQVVYILFDFVVSKG